MKANLCKGGLKKRGGNIRFLSQRSVFTAAANGRSFILSRGKDIPGEVLRGEVDAGFCGEDVYYEQVGRGLCKSLGFIAVRSMNCRLVLGAYEDQALDRPLRVATSFPALSLKLLAGQGYEVASVQEFGGKVEGKLKNGSYDAIVDIVKSGETARDNDIVEKAVLLSDLRAGIVFRKGPVRTEEDLFEPWQMLMALQKMQERKRQLEAGAQPDASRKNTMLLLSDENKLAKAIGEESAELVRALIRDEGVVDEAADMVFTALLAPIRDKSSGLAVLNELIRRNQKRNK